MNAQILEWSDIPFVLAVCEEGSLSGAARHLGVNHSTVFRRIEAVETRLGVTLFERLSHGYVMTAAGEHFYKNALHLKDGVTSIQREIGGQDLRLEGALTVTTTDSLLYSLTPVFAKFQQMYPDVELRLQSGSRPLDLMQRDADIALRPTRNPPEHWIGRNLCSIGYATYARGDYADALPNLPEQQHRWIRLNDSLNQSLMSQITILQQVDGSPVTVANTMMGLFELVRSGLGLGVLPRYLGDTCPELTKISEPDAGLGADLWMLAHPDMRRNAKVHAFFEFAAKSIREDVKGFN